MPIHILTNHIIRNIEKFQNVEKNLPVEFLFIFNGIREKKINGFSQSKNFSFNKKNNGPGPARNLGIKKSKANWLLFLDSDTIPSKNIIQKHFEAQKKYKKIPIIGGSVTPSFQSKCKSIW